MSDIELVITRSNRLERILRTEFNADGRGLHELVGSVERQLPADLVRKLRLVATVRNKVVHDERYEQVEDRKGFKAAATEAERGLLKLKGKGQMSLAAKVVVIVIALTIIAVIAVLMWG